MTKPTTNPPNPDQRAATGAGQENEGEGNRSADRRYREATKRFVDSPRGREAMHEAGNVTPEEAREIADAEQRAKQRAKEHDPAERLDPTKPAS
jgi:hypothetical protein